MVYAALLIVKRENLAFWLAFFPRARRCPAPSLIDNRRAATGARTTHPQGDAHEDSDGSYLQSPTGKQRPENRLLAGGICRSLLCFPRLQLPDHPGLPLGRPTAGRSAKRGADGRDRGDQATGQ